MSLTVQRTAWFLLSVLFVFAWFCGGASAGGGQATARQSGPEGNRGEGPWVPPVDDWLMVRKTPLKFRSYHPQGLVKLADRFLLSSVEVFKRPLQLEGGRRSPGLGKGHLFEFSRDGELLRSVQLAEGDCYHPGGIDFDGVEVWVPVAEYRPESHSIIFRLDPDELTAKEAFRVEDHIGGVAVDRASGVIYGVNWGSRRFYAWTLTGERLWVAENPSFYIEYQDCKWAGSGWAVCSGLESYTVPGKGRLELGGVEILDVTARRPVRQIPVPLYSEKGRVMTQNPFAFEVREGVTTFYFVPDDDESVLYEWQLQQGSMGEGN